MEIDSIYSPYGGYGITIVEKFSCEKRDTSTEGASASRTHKEHQHLHVATILFVMFSFQSTSLVTCT